VNSDTPRDESYTRGHPDRAEGDSRAPYEFPRSAGRRRKRLGFHSRWFGDNMTLTTIRTTSIVPVD